MENIFLFIPFGIYSLFILYELYKAFKNKEANTSIKFSTGSKNYAELVILFTILGTMIGPGYSYGAIDKFYEYGFFYTIFFILAVLQFWLFGHFFAGKIKKIGTNSETVGDILGEAYGKPVQIITGILSAFFSIAIVGVLGLGGGSVLSSMTAIPLNMSIVLVVSFVTLYTFYGGIATVIKTDKIQFLLICAFCIIGLIASIIQYTSNESSIEISDYIFNRNNMPLQDIIGIGIAFFLGEAFIPVYSVRGIIAKNEDTARKAFKKAAYFGFIWFVLLTIIGISAHYVNHSSELSYLSLIKSSFHGVWGFLIIGVAVTGMLSVVMSTLDSILNAAGVSFRKDIIEQLFSVNEDQKLSYTRLSIMLIGVLGVFVTIFFKDIVGLLIWAYTIWVPAIIFPFAYYLIKERIKYKKSGLLGITFGVLGWLVFEFILKIGIPAILIGLLLNVLIVLISEKYGEK